MIMGADKTKESHTDQSLVIDKLEQWNDCKVWIVKFLIGGKLIGKLHRTYHPTIPFEVFTIPYGKSHRCNTISEGENWLRSLLEN